MDIALIGGGAGKTALRKKISKTLGTRGKKIWLITNNQAGAFLKTLKPAVFPSVCDYNTRKPRYE